MKITKYSKSGSSNPALSGGSGGSSSSTEYIGSSSLNRIIWGQQDSGDDVDGSMTIHGNVSIKVIEDLPDVGDDEDDGDGEVEDYETGGGSLFVDENVSVGKTLTVGGDVEVGNHLYINYSHPEHETTKKCVAEILTIHEGVMSTNRSNIEANANDISSLKSRVTTAESDISTLKSRVSVNETNISNNADEIEKLKKKTTDNATAITDLMPIGSIIMFNGQANKIPEHWAICDGKNGTPNLINRFIKAADTAGNTGGSNSITLTSDNMPAHSHIFRNYLTQVHGDGEILNNTMTLDGEEVMVSHSTEKSANPTRRAQTDSDGHSQVPYIQHRTYEEGNTNPSGIDIQPAYYTLIFIMKIA